MLNSSGVIMAWHKITLSKEEVLSGKISEIQHLFRDVFQSHITDFNMSEVVMLSDDLPHDKFIIYFSPKCLTVSTLVDLLDTYSAEKCDPPFKGNIGLLCGDADFAQKFIRYER